MGDRLRAVIYARISLDRKEGAGVARQIDDCRKLAKERGWRVLEEFVDNDVSAYRRKRRPEWERLVSQLDRFDVLVAYHPDRLYRRTRDLEDLIDAIEGTSTQVATVRAGDMDLSTASGRMVARMLGAAARHESERMGERVARAKAGLAADGKPSGGGMRPFGFEADRVTLNPVEAGLVRDAAERVAAGGSMFQICEEWNAAGHTTTTGRPWSVKSLSRTLASPRMAGIRTYRGEEVGPALWPAIVDVETWRRVQAMNLGRRRGPSKTEWLLSGMIACPKCGRVLYGSPRGSRRSYACAPQGGGVGCGGCSVDSIPVEAKVSAAVETILKDAVPHAAKAYLNRGSASSELDAITARKMSLTKRWAAGALTDDEYDAARSVLAEREAALDVPGPVPSSVPDLRVAWRRGSVAAKRAVIQSVIRLPMSLTPGRAANPADRLTVEPKWA